MADRQARQGSNSRRRLGPHPTARLLTSFVVAALATFLIVRLLIEIIRRLRQFFAGPPPALPSIELPPLVEAPPTEAPMVEIPVAEAPSEGVQPSEPPLAETSTTEFIPAEPGVTYEIPVVVAPAIPDLHLTVPPDLVVQSFEPKYQFNWQNPTLVGSIYPFRKDKLVDILAWYAEIELVKEFKTRSTSDPQIMAEITRAVTEMKAARQEVETRLRAMIEARKQLPTDLYFKKITATNEKTLFFKYKYYLDRVIDSLEDKLDVLEDQKTALLKRVDWYEKDDPRQQLWRDRAAEKDPDIQELKEELSPVKEFRQLFDRLEQLPAPDAQQGTKEAAMRWLMRARRESWLKKTNEQLVEEIIHLINAKPNNYPEWLVYMLFHFSGMRYVSAHGSYADPRFLLEVLEREEAEDQVNEMPPTELAQACAIAAQDLQRVYDPTSKAPEQRGIGSMLNRIKAAGVQKRALIEYRVEQALARIKALKDDKACLERLVQFKAEKDLAGEPMPEWVWAEIVKYTPLRLNTQDPDWEAYSKQRWQYQERRWAEILNEWEQKDITSWRSKHHETLELVVTRSVCNEIAEHIQHLRGNTPAAGLTSKPNWYMRQAEKNPLAYFKQAPAEEEFKTGASILWLEWMVQKPSPWQMARPLSGFSLYPGEHISTKPGKKGEVREKDLAEPGWDTSSGWQYRPFSDFYTRQRKKPNPKELRQQRKSEEEIRKILASGDTEIEYLRWRHEATVVDVVEMIGGKFVMTFETGKIGLILRRLDDLLGNPMIFVGYIPETPLSEVMDQKLFNMLKWERILPGKTLKSRVRPLKKADISPTPTSGPEPVTAPQRMVMVLREQIRCYKYTNKDNLGRPKFEAATPPLQLRRGERLNVYATQKESNHDRGDGVITGLDGKYLKVSGYTKEARATNLFVRMDEVVDYGAGKWVRIHPQIQKSNAQKLKGYDDKSKPYFEPLEKDQRLILTGGDRVRVSTTHKECFMDSGDGVINSSGRVHTYYLVLECPKIPALEGLFLQINDTVPE